MTRRRGPARQLGSLGHSQDTPDQPHGVATAVGQQLAGRWNRI